MIFVGESYNFDEMIQKRKPSLPYVVSVKDLMGFQERKKELFFKVTHLISSSRSRMIEPGPPPQSIGGSGCQSQLHFELWILFAAVLVFGYSQSWFKKRRMKKRIEKKNDPKNGAPEIKK